MEESGSDWDAVVAYVVIGVHGLPADLHWHEQDRLDGLRGVRDWVSAFVEGAAGRGEDGSVIIDIAST